MKLRNQRIAAAYALIAVFGLASCSTHTGPVINPAIPKTALQWTIILNASVSEGVLAVQHGVREAQSQNVISVQQARPIMQATGRVATLGKSIVAITSKGTEASWNVDGPAIRKLIADANITIPTAANPAIDLLVATLNASLLLLSQGVK